jgi:CRISPR-associated protein Cmr5
MAILRDQARARHAYACVASVPTYQRDDYKIAVNAFGAHVMRTGLCAAIAWLQRRDSDAAGLFLGHLDAAGIRGLPAGGATFVEKVHAVDAASYMIATRDTLALVVWFRRAVQALAAGGAGDKP